MFVPVDTLSSGVSVMPFTAAREVPSPPRTTRQPTPCRSIIRAARTVSSIVASISKSSRPKARLSTPSFSSESCTAQPIMKVSGMNSASSTPMPWAARTMRLQMLTFSLLSMVVA